MHATTSISHYYPFGLKHSGYNGSALNPKYQYKYQGQERQNELNLNWDSFKWRNYDYAIGRFMSVDPLSEKYSYQSHYNFSENRVIDARELEGLEAFVLNTRTFAPFDTFGGGFHGDGDSRKFSTNKYETSRIAASATLDFANYGANSVASASSHSDWLGTEFSSATSESYAKLNFVSTYIDSSSEVAFKISADLHNYGNNDAMMWGVAAVPDIDAKVNIVMELNNNLLNVSGKVFGDKFPANETFLTDEGGNSIFLGVSGADGSPFYSLFGNNDREMSSFNLEIVLNNDNTFSSINYNGVNYSIEDWNSQFTNLNPQSGETTTNY